MSFRTVVIANQSKLSYKNHFLVVKKASEEKYIHLSEIDTIIVDSISVSISAYLLKELSDNKINIIFCDDKHNPFGEIKSYYSKHNSSKKILEQIEITIPWGYTNLLLKDEYKSIHSSTTEEIIIPNPTDSSII